MSSGHDAARSTRGKSRGSTSHNASSPSGAESATESAPDAVTVADEETVLKALTDCKRSARNDNWKPVPCADGWSIRVHYRANASGFKSSDVYFLSPNDVICRSLPDVQRWFESGGLYRPKVQAGAGLKRQKVETTQWAQS